MKKVLTAFLGFYLPAERKHHRLQVLFGSVKISLSRPNRLPEPFSRADRACALSR